ncbi:MAG: MFS transporter [Acidimicrobiales bacterium]|nr:MFS transporter [Acidimicrobiales bacterium]
MFLRTRTVFSVFRAAFGNPVLRRVGFAYALFGTAEFGIWIALLVFAYRHGGSTASMLMVLIQLIPCIALGPFLGAIADRRRPSRVLRVGYGFQAVSMAGVATAIGLGVPAVVVFVLAPLTALTLTITRPPQAALLPAIVRSPDELTAANVMGGWTEGAAALVGPAVVGILIAWRGPALAVAAMAGLALTSWLLVTSVTGPAAAIPPGVVPDDAGTNEENRSVFDLITRAGQALTSIRSGVRSNLEVTVRNPQIRILLTLHTFYFVLIGALDLLCVILALSLLHMGPGGPGFLNAALGGGALVAGFVTAFLVGRRHLIRTLTISLSVAVVALALIDAIPRVAPAILLIGTVGLAGAVFDITGRTLLQRSAPSDAIAGSFSILEALMDLGLALGVVLVRVAIAIGGLKAALITPAVVALVLIAGLWRKLQRIDAMATVPQVEIQLLRSIPIFAALPAPSIEGVARELQSVTVSPGTVVIKEGEPGDRYYVVADGEMAISRHGRLLQTVSRGDGFGEIALIHDVPRQASVTAVTDACLYALHKELFVQTVTGHAVAASAVRTIVSGHLGDDMPMPWDGGGPEEGEE